MSKQKRFVDLAGQAYRNNIFTFSDFCGDGELADFYQEMATVGDVHYELYGGHAEADRLVVRFGNKDELGYEVEWPISTLMITPLNKKFSETLTHRDFLGALMNLGIERSMIGDILVGDGCACVFVIDSMAEYICSELTRIKHTVVTASVSDELPPQFETKYKEMEIQIPSERIDVVVARFAKLSRKDTADYFHDRRIFVDGRVMENYSHVLKTGSKVSVRGVGKFIYDGVVRHTRSDNLIVSIRVFV